PGGARPADLVAYPRNVGGKFHRPRQLVTAPEPQRRAGAGQPQIRGVVVDGAKVRRWARSDLRTGREAVGQVGYDEPRIGLVLPLLLKHPGSLVVENDA